MENLFKKSFCSNGTIYNKIATITYDSSEEIDFDRRVNMALDKLEKGKNNIVKVDLQTCEKD